MALNLSDNFLIVAKLGGVQLVPDRHFGNYCSAFEFKILMEETMTKLKMALTAAVLLGLSCGTTIAMPLNNLAKIDVGVKPDTVRWVCNDWGRCWWRPNYYGAYAYYGPGPYLGWRHRHWRRW